MNSALHSEYNAPNLSLVSKMFQVIVTVGFSKEYLNIPVPKYVSVKNYFYELTNSNLKTFLNDTGIKYIVVRRVAISQVHVDETWKT